MRIITDDKNDYLYSVIMGVGVSDGGEDYDEIEKDDADNYHVIGKRGNDDYNDNNILFIKIGAKPKNYNNNDSNNKMSDRKDRISNLSLLKIDFSCHYVIISLFFFLSY